MTFVVSAVWSESAYCLLTFW